MMSFLVEPDTAPGREAPKSAIKRLRLWSVLLVPFATLLAQHPTPSGLEDTLRQARQEISDFQKAGGKNDDPGHPAPKWAATLWQWRDRLPASPDASRATTEAVRLLVFADRFADVQ